jgi:hypothetical protein
VQTSSCGEAPGLLQVLRSADGPKAGETSAFGLSGSKCGCLTAVFSTLQDVLAHFPWARPSIALKTLMPSEWARDAACAHLEPEKADELFFPEQGKSSNAGRALCRCCPVSRECLEYALRFDADGIWAGTSPLERRGMRRRLGYPPWFR